MKSTIRRNYLLPSLRWRGWGRGFIYLIAALFLISCTPSTRTVTVTVSNPLGIDREGEMIEVEMSEISDLLRLPDTAQIVVLNGEGEQVPYQVTYDDRLIFPVTVKADATTTFTVGIGMPIDVEVRTCGRQYPERLDDVAWENDLVGFRAYGPALQARGERGFGYDLFTKRGTHSPILEEMYAHDLDGTLSYHIDHGYGMDCYAVGPTLGAGVSALMVCDTLLYPWCYKTQEVLDNGPLRFTVRLEFAPVSVNADSAVVETRLISLDAGSHLNRTTVTYDGLSSSLSIATGIVLHEPDSLAQFTTAADCMAYSDPTTGTDNGRIFVGAAFPAGGREVKPVFFSEQEKPLRNNAEGHLLALSDYEPGIPYTYYWGFAWSRADIPDFDTWHRYLTSFASIVRNPLQVTVGP